MLTLALLAGLAVLLAVRATRPDLSPAAARLKAQLVGDWAYEEDNTQRVLSFTARGRFTDHLGTDGRWWPRDGYVHMRTWNEPGSWADSFWPGAQEFDLTIRFEGDKAFAGIRGQEQQTVLTRK